MSSRFSFTFIYVRHFKSFFIRHTIKRQAEAEQIQKHAIITGTDEKFTICTASLKKICTGIG
jgi:hypothetical protein